MAVTAERNKEWDYTSPSTIKIFNMSKKQGSFGFPTCQEMAQAVAQNLEENTVIEKVELKQAGNGDPAKSGFFLNITLKNDFIQDEIMRLLKNGPVSVAVDEETKT